MDEEGYEFGEAVKEAMAQMGYKDGGLMVAIQRFNQGGRAVIDSRATVEDMAKAILKRLQQAMIDQSNDTTECSEVGHLATS